MELWGTPLVKKPVALENVAVAASSDTSCCAARDVTACLTVFSPSAGLWTLDLESIRLRYSLNYLGRGLAGERNLSTFTTLLTPFL